MKKKRITERLKSEDWRARKSCARRFRARAYPAQFDPGMSGNGGLVCWHIICRIFSPRQSRCARARLSVEFNRTLAEQYYEQIEPCDGTGGSRRVDESGDFQPESTRPAAPGTRQSGRDAPAHD